MTPDDLTQIPGIGEKTVEKIRRVVTDYFEQDRESSAGVAAPAEAEGVKAEEPPAEPPATLDEATEKESNAAGVSVQPEGAEPAPERTESSKDEASAGGEGREEE